MTEEKAIQLLRSYAGMTHKLTDNQGRPKLDQAIEKALNIIQKQQVAIETLETTIHGYQGLTNVIDAKQEELEKKDKMIDLMINLIRGYDIDFSDICKKRFRLCDECEYCVNDCIKQYFEKQL